MNVLGIETSCDETSLCLLKGKEENVQIIETLTFSQVEIYKKWGGVVPEIASRNHLAKLQPLLEELCEKTKFDLTQLDLIGVTSYPGLLGPLLTGLNLAKTIALYHQVPLYPVNHLFAHLEAIHMTEKTSYPYIGVILSGGHSLFCYVESSSEMKVLASTIDDAAGEAFDKGGKLLELGYPAGPIIDQKAKEGDSQKFSFPIGLQKERDNPNMSFSGLKTSLRNLLEKHPEYRETQLPHICASYQEAIVNSIKEKLSIVMKKHQLPIVVGGGVACNSRLREVLSSNFQHISFVAPAYCTDNASMIANFAYRNRDLATAFPQNLSFDAKSRFIDKTEFQL